MTGKKGHKKTDTDKAAFERFKEYERWKKCVDDKYEDVPSSDTERAHHGVRSKYTANESMTT